MSAETITATDPGELLAGHTFLCEGCGRPVSGEHSATVFFMGKGGSPDVHCPDCSRNLEHSRARDLAATWAAEAAGGTYYYKEHFLADLDGGPVFLPNVEAAVAVALELRSLGINTVLEVAMARLAYPPSHEATVRAVARKHGAR